METELVCLNGLETSIFQGVFQDRLLEGIFGDTSVLARSRSFSYSESLPYWWPADFRQCLGCYSLSKPMP